MEHFAKYALASGGDIKPLLCPASETGGTGLMNPSILNWNGKLIVNVRHVNYTFYHSEKKLFQHPFGPLTYLHPENDMHLRTWNWYGELDDDLNVTRMQRIDTSKFVEEEKWDFVGLEDVRLMNWNGKLYTTGVRRDLKPTGEGRMEMCEIVVDDATVTEVSRFRIPPPNDPTSYCEKNWMPILDKPNQYVKWSNPIEVVEVDPENKSCKTVFNGEYNYIPRDLRGGTQVVPIGDYYVALTHEVDLFHSEVGRKDAVYRHRFIVWDRNWKMVRFTDDFSIMAGLVEFAVGMDTKDDDVFITFGFQDNAAYVLKMPTKAMMEFIFDEQN